MKVQSNIVREPVPTPPDERWIRVNLTEQEAMDIVEFIDANAPANDRPVSGPHQIIVAELASELVRALRIYHE